MLKRSAYELIWRFLPKTTCDLVRCLLIGFVQAMIFNCLYFSDISMSSNLVGRLLWGMIFSDSVWMGRLSTSRTYIAVTWIGSAYAVIQQRYFSNVFEKRQVHASALFDDTLLSFLCWLAFLPLLTFRLRLRNFRPYTPCWCLRIYPRSNSLTSRSPHVIIRQLLIPTSPICTTFHICSCATMCASRKWFPTRSHKVWGSL